MKFLTLHGLGEEVMIMICIFFFKKNELLTIGVIMNITRDILVHEVTGFTTLQLNPAESNFKEPKHYSNGKMSARSMN